jgi:hypothetical protein
MESEKLTDHKKRLVEQKIAEAETAILKLEIEILNEWEISSRATRPSLKEKLAEIRARRRAQSIELIYGIREQA